MLFRTQRWFVRHKGKRQDMLEQALAAGTNLNSPNAGDS